MSTSLAPPAVDQCTAYARAVARGEVVVGTLVRLACARHLRDLDDAGARGFYFDAAAAEKAIKFYTLCPHIKGEWASGAEIGIVLAPWQCFIVGSLFGWKRIADDLRRFRTAYVEVARKNGKSTMMSPAGILLAFFDNEPGAEVYSAATKKDQAKIVWSDARRMVRKQPAFAKRIRAYVENLHDEATASKFEPLGADADSLDGLNIHGAIVDELHAHKSRAVVDVLETAIGARRQPLTIYITTAGFDRHSVCWTTRDYTTRIVEGIVEDDTWFGYVATLDEGDAWADPTVWIKANPNLGTSPKVETLVALCAKAQEIPSAQQEFRRKHCNQWTESATRWIGLEAWDACGGDVDPEQLVGRACYGGLDLSSTTDLTSFGLVFPPVAEGERWKFLSYSFCPEESIHKRAERDRVPYPLWRDGGLLTATPGNQVDYSAVEARVEWAAERYKLVEVAIDRWNATATINNLTEKGITVVPFGQGFQSMTAPTKEFERMILAGLVEHDGSPLLKWTVSNVVVERDAAENLKPSKAKSTERIDPVVALIMATGRAMVGGTPKKSVYEERGLRGL